MAYKSTGTAAKSSSGASMSRYDVEVESRLQALEKAVESLQAAAEDCPGTTAAGGVDPRVDQIIAHIAKKEDVSDIG